MMITRPMLSATIKPENQDSLVYPLMGSPKLDGIRCLIHPELGPVTRSFKPIPNEHIKNTLNCTELHGLDGELVLHPDPKIFTFNEVQSAVMSRSGAMLFYYMIFDQFDVPQASWTNRTAGLEKLRGPPLRWTPHMALHNWEQVQKFEQAMVGAGYEGIMLRQAGAPYKSGRSTMREQYLMKLKRHQDTEGTIIGFVEQLHNTNPMEQDEFGLAKRSSHKENLVGAGKLGKLVVDHPEWGELHIGTGFTDAQRQTIWNSQSKLLGKTVTFKHEPVLKEKPRFPVFLRFRLEDC